MNSSNTENNYIKLKIYQCVARNGEASQPIRKLWVSVEQSWMEIT